MALWKTNQRITTGYKRGSEGAGSEELLLSGTARDASAQNPILRASEDLTRAVRYGVL